MVQCVDFVVLCQFFDLKYLVVCGEIVCMGVGVGGGVVMVVIGDDDDLNWVGVIL